jgi:hypothetical protein
MFLRGAKAGSHKILWHPLRRTQGTGVCQRSCRLHSILRRALLVAGHCRLAKEEGISVATLGKWRAEARAKGQVLPDANAGPEGWSSADTLAPVIETASLNAAELGEYCRRRGIYAEQLAVWREACARANDWEPTASRQIVRETKDASRRIQQLERDLIRKEKALTEAAALMILRKRWMRSGAARSAAVTPDNSSI